METYQTFIRQVTHHQVADVWYSDASYSLTAQLTNGNKVKAPSPASSEFHTALLNQGIMVYPQTSIGDLIIVGINSLFSLLILVMLMAWMGSLMKSNAKFSFAKINDIHFDDVAGLHATKAEMREWVDYLKNRHLLNGSGANPPKGMLLSGPPGTGKTMLAKALAAEAGVAFAAVSGAEFVEKFVGVGAARVRSLFKRAKKKSPCIIFIDEFDAVAKARGERGGNHEYDSTVNQLLVELDGVKDRDGIFVIAATNHLQGLDPALLRPGRFDRMITLGLPSEQEREEILAVHAKSKTFVPALDQKAWAKRAIGWSGANIANFLNEAALEMVRKGEPAIRPEHLETAFEKIIAGGPGSQTLSARDLATVARHEAGHAVMAYWQGRRVSRIRCLPTQSGAGGYTRIDPLEHQFRHRQELEADILILLGGRVAEILMAGAERITQGAGSDLEKARQIVLSLLTDYGDEEGRIGYDESDPRLPKKARDLLRSLEGKAMALLQSHEDVLYALVAHLQDVETMEEDEIERWFTKHQQLHSIPKIGHN